MINLDKKFNIKFPVECIPEHSVISPRSGVIQDCENRECRDFFMKKPWNEIDRELLATKKCFLPNYLTHEGFAYYIPCLILASVENRSSDLGAFLEELFISQPTWFTKIIARFSADQKQLLYDSMMIELNERYGDWLESDVELKSDVSKIGYLLKINC